MKVLFVAAEAAPFVKVGGLGDVIGSLPKALQDENVEARVVLPLYSSIDREKYNLQYKQHIFIDLGWRHIYCGIFETEVNGVTYYFIDNEHYFNRSSVYGQDDDGERFAFFSKAALEILPFIDYKPDILNANDWHTALSIIYLDDFKSRGLDFYKDIKSVISIHNIEFQGRFNPYEMGNLFGLDNKYFDALIYNGDLNLLKGAIQLSNRISTVSETYAHEILDPYFSYGLDSILKIEQGKLHGIVNGLDIDKFNSETDKQIFKNFNINTLKDKVENKLRFQEELALEVNENIPMIGMVTRLTHQKGIDLVLHVADEILKTGAQLIILGTGDSHYEDALRALEYRRHDKVRSLIMFSSEMSSKVYSACDMFLMPSKTEPCDGKYGTGFTFESFDAYDMLDAVYRATYCYYQERHNWNKLMKNTMVQDVSWKKSALKYINMYNEIV